MTDTFEINEESIPFFNAAGSNSGLNEGEISENHRILCNTQLGIITFGSITLPEQQGNPGDVFYFDEETGTTTNSVGLRNIGLARAKILVPKLIQIAEDKGKVFIVSVSPTFNSEENGNTFEQIDKLITELLKVGVKSIEINLSCPNLIDNAGHPKPLVGYDFDAVATLLYKLAQIVGINSDVSIGIKLPPYMTPEQVEVMQQIADLIWDNKIIKFICTSNTIPNQEAPHLTNKRGGESGPKNAPLGRQQLEMWVKALKNDRKSPIEILSTLGIDSAEELAKRIELGALAGGGVTIFWTTPNKNWPKLINKIAFKYAELLES